MGSGSSSPEDALPLALLAAVGVRDPRAAERALADMARTPEEGEALRALLPALAEELRLAGSPDRGLANVRRLFEAAPSRLALLLSLARDRPLLARTVILCSQSQFFADAIVREPFLLEWLGGEATPPSRAALLSDLERELRLLTTEENRLEAIRRFQRRQLLAVGFRDHVLGLPLPSTTGALSTIAEVAIEACLGLARSRLRERLPELAADTLPFSVVALGKLGGGELNYSSDIDLVFVHDEQFTAHGLSAREVFERLGKELLRLLSESASGAPLYRVDMRLRPEGGPGALSRGISAYVRYYESYGRTWERQALLKARPVAGDAATGARFLEAILPFVYRRALDIVAIGEIQALKRTIEARGAARPTRDVKEGPGGIRDVEFSVQFLLLLHGSELPEVRDPGTLGAIAKLRAADALGSEDARALEEAYIFFRTVEHRLQSLYALQTHELPADPAEVLDLARRLGFRGAEPSAELAEALDRHGRESKRVLDRVLHGLFPAPRGALEEGAARAAALLLEASPDEEKARAALALAGMKDPARAAGLIRRLGTETSRLLSRSPRTRAALAGALPSLLRHLARQPDPDEALLRFERAASTLGGKAIFFELLAQRPDLSALFVNTAGESGFLSDLLARSPGAFDEVLDLLVTQEPLTAERILERIRAAEAARLPDPLRAVSCASTLLTGLRDVGGIYNITNVMEALSALADATLRSLAPGAGSGLAILALGKLGGRELGYGSDLDLVPAFEGEREPALKATQALLRRLDELKLYGVDLRLRPEGSAGPLATSFQGLLDYYASERAETWERLAAVKLRPVAGDLDLAARLLPGVLDAVYAPRPREKVLRDAREMRLRLEPAKEGPLDLKRGPGGLMDIEFLVGCLKLLSGGRPAEVREPGVVPALHALARAGLLEQAAYVEILTGYQLFRKIEAKLRLESGRAVSRLPEDPRALASLARRLGYVDGKRKDAARAFEDELRYTLRRVRARWEELVRGA